jgi:hypothetical protein
MSMRLKSQAGSYDEPRSYRLPSLKLVQFPLKNNTETNSKRANKIQKPEPKCDLETDVLCGRGGVASSFILGSHAEYITPGIPGSGLPSGTKLDLCRLLRALKR